jgi:hypothetical protein
MGCRGNCAQGHAACPHPVQCQPSTTEQTLTDWGLLAEPNYSEPDRLELPPITRVERLVLWLIAAASVAGLGSAVVSCTA